MHRKYYLWVDTETAGLLFDKKGNELPANLMELSAVLTDSNFNKIFEHDWIIKYSDKMRLAMSPEIYELHSNNGLISECKKSNTTISDVNKNLSKLLEKYVNMNNSTIILSGNNISYDKEVIRRNLPDVFDKLYYLLLDVSSIKEMLLLVNSKIVYNAQNKKKYTHRALKDINESILELKDYWTTFVDVTNLYMR